MTTVERVARAICEARALPGTAPAKPSPWSSDVDKRAARAAIEAMRDLGDEAYCALSEMPRQPYKPGSHSAREIFQALVDAALGDE